MLQRKVVVLLLLAAACSSALYSQVAAGLGGLTGIVTDASGATVPNAEVLVDNERLGINRKLTTGNGGVFNVPALAPSAGYQVTPVEPRPASASTSSRLLSWRRG